MNRKDRGILVGMVLGDGCLSVRKRKNTKGSEYISAELIIAHSIKQLPYLEYKSEILRKMLGGHHNVKFNDVYLKKTGKRYKIGRMAKSNPYFKTLKGMMYPEGKKRITRSVLDMLTPEGIAIWYMDDGGCRYKRDEKGKVTSISTDIATYCSEKEANDICDYFKEVHGINFKPCNYKGKNGVFIRANTSESRLFATLVKPYLHKSMMYKLDHVQYKDGQECRAPEIRRQCEECNKIIKTYLARGRCRSCYEKHIRSLNKESMAKI